MQFWPRARARHNYARIRNWQPSKEVKLLGFAGYKAGMTHLLVIDNNTNSLTKNTEIFCPVTIIECPPIKTASIRFYKNTTNGLKLVSELFADAVDKEIEKKILQHRKKGREAKEFDIVRLLCYTQPKLTGIGKKLPETFEIAIGGTKEQQAAFAKEKRGKEIHVNEVFKEGQQLDAHSLTKAKGFQGPVKRFGIQLRQHKSEKSRRNPGSLGAWNAQGHIMWRVAHAGKTGYNLRTEYNKMIAKIGNKPEEITPKGGFLHYGNVKNTYMLIKGSLPGTGKRLVRFTEATRPKRTLEAPQVTYISIESKQGR